MDLKEKDNCIKLYEMTKKENIDILVNNAGFGEFGEFVNTPLQKELDMIDVNVVAVHILTKLFLKAQLFWIDQISISNETNFILIPP